MLGRGLEVLSQPLDCCAPAASGGTADHDSQRSATLPTGSGEQVVMAGFRLFGVRHRWTRPPRFRMLSRSSEPAQRREQKAGLPQRAAPLAAHCISTRPVKGWSLGRRVAIGYRHTKFSRID